LVAICVIIPGMTDGTAGATPADGMAGREGGYGFNSFDGFDGFAGFDAFAGFDVEVRGILYILLKEKISSKIICLFSKSTLRICEVQWIGT
jgi:hypothetical protein